MTYARTNKPRITDEEILGWMNEGKLLVLGGDVLKWNHRSKRHRKLKVYSCDEDGRLRVNLRVGNRGTDQERQRTCYLNKLVWMYHHRQVVPAGYVIDHKNNDCTDDSIENLQLQTEEESDRQGWELQGHLSADDEYGEF